MARLTDEEYMQEALVDARRAGSLGEVPIGAVVVYEPRDPETGEPIADAQIAGRGFNMKEMMQDPAGHAEFLAMKNASNRMHSWRLKDCTVYVTVEPCLMCAGLMIQTRIDRCVYGAPNPKGGALGSNFTINDDDHLNHKFEVTSGVCQDECAKLISDFFAERRA